ncbi:MAG: Rrf2 family transcriptional regulator [Intestinibacter bartlettii]
MLGQLKAAGLVEVVRGTGGASIANHKLITFLDIYKVVECVDNGELFHLRNPNTKCPVIKHSFYIG